MPQQKFDIQKIWYDDTRKIFIKNPKLSVKFDMKKTIITFFFIIYISDKSISENFIFLFLSHGREYMDEALATSMGEECVRTKGEGSKISSQTSISFGYIQLRLMLTTILQKAEYSNSIEVIQN